VVFLKKIGQPNLTFSIRIELHAPAQPADLTGLGGAASASLCDLILL
jgi:hypothetical protein